MKTMLLSAENRKKALAAGFEERFLDNWNGQPHIVGLTLFYVTKKGVFKLVKCKTKQVLDAKLYSLGKSTTLTSHSLLELDEAGVQLSRQQKQRARVRAEKNARKRK